ncbi:MAG: formylglycine-generating enzyme family protein [Phycisphaerales bacterium]|nr:MAG: formylglycine-generating enzyme family protein [Phycisphaerales bacterium]
MKHYLTTVFALLTTLVVLQGCKRQTPDDGARAPDDAPGTSKTESGGASHLQTDVPMIHIPGGQFTMGDQTEIDAAPHEVVISPFYMDKNLVTQEQYEKVMGENPSRWKGPGNPVEQMRWSDAARYCNARSEREGLDPCYDLQTWKCNFEANGYRLPTEAEWEYACRAGTKTAYFFGDNPSKLTDYAWFEKNSGGKPKPVGQKPPNPWGLCDMHGNVWEWCNDFYQVDYYQQSPKEDPRGPKTGETKVVRGGAWKFSAESCRSAYRYNEDPGYADVCFGYDIYGFRCVRNASP